MAEVLENKIFYKKDNSPKNEVFIYIQRLQKKDLKKGKRKGKTPREKLISLFLCAFFFVIKCFKPNCI